MLKRFFLFCLIPLLITGCIQIGNYQLAKPIPGYTYTPPSQTRFSKADLNAHRKNGEYYTRINAKRNSHLPKGKPYTVRGETYVPYTSAQNFEEIGIASWYGPGFHGKKTANGETFNTNDLTAAHKLLPFNTRIKVTNLENGRSVIVRINDRGPFLHERIIDLSKEAANRIGMLKKGTAKVHLQYVGGGANSGYVSEPTFVADNSDDVSVIDDIVGSKEPVNPYESGAVYTPDNSASIADALASASAMSGASYSATSSAPVNQSQVIAPSEIPPPTYATQNPNAIPESSYQNLSPNTVIGQLYLHLAVYKDRAMAQRLSVELRKRKIPTTIFTDNGFFVVQAGPYQNKTQVEKVRQYLKGHFPKSYLVVR